MTEADLRAVEERSTERLVELVEGVMDVIEKLQARLASLEERVEGMNTPIEPGRN